MQMGRLQSSGYRCLSPSSEPNRGDNIYTHYIQNLEHLTLTTERDSTSLPFLLKDNCAPNSVPSSKVSLPSVLPLLSIPDSLSWSNIFRKQSCSEQTRWRRPKTTNPCPPPSLPAHPASLTLGAAVLHELAEKQQQEAKPAGLVPRTGHPGARRGARSAAARAGPGPAGLWGRGGRLRGGRGGERRGGGGERGGADPGTREPESRPGRRREANQDAPPGAERSEEPSAGWGRRGPSGGRCRGSVSSSELRSDFFSSRLSRYTHYK